MQSHAAGGSYAPGVQRVAVTDDSGGPPGNGPSSEHPSGVHACRGDALPRTRSVAGYRSCSMTLVCHSI